MKKPWETGLSILPKRQLVYNVGLLPYLILIPDISSVRSIYEGEM
jgi:hypothetical protein